MSVHGQWLGGIGSGLFFREGSCRELREQDERWTRKRAEQSQTIGSINVGFVFPFCRAAVVRVCVAFNGDRLLATEWQAWVCFSTGCWRAGRVLPPSQKRGTGTAKRRRSQSPFLGFVLSA